MTERIEKEGKAAVLAAFYPLLFVLLESVSQMYLTFWAKNKEAGEDFSPPPFLHYV